MRGLFLGIGGTGDEILTHLKDKLYASFGSLPDTVQFRLIDTEAEEYRKNHAARLGGKDEDAAISGYEYLQLRDEPTGAFVEIAHRVAEQGNRDPEVARWFRADLFLKNLPKADLNLVRGAGQHRQVARMGTFLNRHRIINLLQSGLRRCSEGGGEIPIWIVGSVAGGTGAGLFMDLALLAHWVARQERVSYRVIGVGVLPDVFSELGIDPARAYAVVRELERFQAPVDTRHYGTKKGGDGGFRFAVPYDSNTTVYLPSFLFENLVFFNRKCEGERQRKDYFSEIADGLNLLLDESAGDQLFREWINVEEGYAASFSTKRIFLPAKLYRRQFALEGAKELADGLLPRDPTTHALIFGSVADREKEAHKIIASEISSDLFGPFTALQTDKERRELSEDLTSDHLVRITLGFTNPIGRFGGDIGEDVAMAANRLWANIYKTIEPADKVKGESLDDSKTRVKADVVRLHRAYMGDGEGSLTASLHLAQRLVESRLKEQIDESVRGFIAARPAKEQALGKTLKVLDLARDLLIGKVRDEIERVTNEDGAKLEALRAQETQRLTEMDDVQKGFLGSGKTALAEKQEQYLHAAAQVLMWEQRRRLVQLLKGLVTVAEQRFAFWIESLQGWVGVLTDVIKVASDELDDISERLERQTKVNSSSIGLKNDVQMDGYRDHLKAQCLRDTSADEPLITNLLKNLRWEAEAEGLRLLGWPEIDALSASQFPQRLDATLATRVGHRMDEVEGMANYLEWLNDVKKDPVSKLPEWLAGVTQGFADIASTGESRRFLLLHGDDWGARPPKNLFNVIYDTLETNPNVRHLAHNLKGAEGTNLFKDKNVIALMMSDKTIPYQEIRVIESMRREYFQARADETPPWRVETLHLFRCDQEAWSIERARIFAEGAGGNVDYPMIPGELSRLLDQPEYVEAFAKALALGLIHQQEVGLGGKVWVCGPKGDERQLVYLNDPDDPKDPKDLLRAFITFVLDQADRRPRKSGRLELDRINKWMLERLKEEQVGMAQAIEAFRDAAQSNAELFGEDLLSFEEEDLRAADEATRARAFLALVIDHYLRKGISN